MRKTAVIILMLAALLLSACGAVEPFTETMYVPEEPVTEPTSSAAPEFAVHSCFSEVELENETEFICSYRGSVGYLINIPSDWHYEVIEWDEESRTFGIDFWPSGSGDGRLRLRYYDGMFGVCGTGLEEVEGELPGTGKLRVGYYDGHDYPSFISFYDTIGGWALVNDMGSAWNSHETEIEKILGSLVLDPETLRVSEAEEAALEWSDADYDYLRTSYDVEGNYISVWFTRMGGEIMDIVNMQPSGGILNCVGEPSA